MENCFNLLNKSNSLLMDAIGTRDNNEIEFSEFKKISRFHATKIYRPLMKKTRSGLADLRKGNAPGAVDISEEKKMYKQMKEMLAAAKANLTGST